MRLNDSPKERFDQERIAANIPARLQPDARMRESDLLHTLGISAIEPAFDNAHPMAHLRALGGAHMAFIGEKA